jgi:serine protease Do
MLLLAGLAAGLLFSGVLNAPAPELRAAEEGAGVATPPAAQLVTPASPEPSARGHDLAAQLEGLFSDAAEAVSPAVVAVQMERTVRRRVRTVPAPFFRDPFFEDLFPRREREFKQTGLGSGFILDQEGHILTNNHVVEGADELRVSLADGRSFAARLVGSDVKTELAVIRIDEEVEDLPTVRLGNSEEIRIGQWVLAIGNPFGFGNTVTAGIVSATGRRLGVADYESLIQTDAAINKGNSGGPLVNLRGEVIGINTAIYSRTGENAGIGFAIPINMATEILEDLIAGREVVRGYLGIRVGNVTPELAEQFGFDGTDGAFIHHIYPGSPAEKAGLKPGDVIIEYDGHAVTNQHELRRRAAGTDPGSKLELKVWREGEEQTFAVQVGNLAEAESLAAGGEPGSTEGDWLGLHVRPLTEDAAERLGDRRLKGALVAEVEDDSIAEKAGIRLGDVVLEVNRKPVSSVDQYRQLLSRTSPRTGVLLRVLDARTGYGRYVGIRGRGGR